MRPSALYLAFTAALLGVSTDSHAGGPLVTTTNGLAVGWDTTAPVSYHTDQGGLGYLANGDAVAAVGTLFAIWTAVPSAVIAFDRAGATAVDIDATNFGPYLGPYGGSTTPLGQNVIAFDADGSIFDALYGVGTGVLGFAGPTFFSDGVTTVAIGDPVPPGARIIEGLAFLNGKWIDGINDPPSRNYELSLDDFEAVFVHEFGHFAGLDHTQVHGLARPPESDSYVVTLPVETMFPFLYDVTQKTPERDDTVALSVLYPSATFASSTGRITGRVLASDGRPLSGANVVAHNIADDSDAVSYVSGATIVPPGAYSLAGLTPGASYRVEVQAVDSVFTGGSRVGPFSPPIVMPGPPEAYNGLAESADPDVDDRSAATPIVAAAGVVATGIDLALNYQSFSVSNVPLEAESQLRSFALGDFDGDDVVDFVAPQWGFVPGNLTRFYQGLGGRFAAPVTIDAFPGNGAAVAAQLNPGVDSFLDVAVLSSSLLEIRVYFGDGSGGFSAPVILLDLPNDSSKYMTELVAGKLNGDGSTDLLTVVVDQPSDSAMSYALLGSSSGTFTIVPTAFASGSGFPRGAALRLGQFAGGPALDVIGTASSTGLGLLTGDGAGGFTASFVSLSAISLRLGYTFDVGDFDEDGRSDIAIPDFYPVGGPPNYSRSFIDVLLGDGSGGFMLSARYAVPELFQDGIVVTDIDGDGHLDVASTGSSGRGHPGARVHLVLGNGAGGVGPLQAIWGIADFPTFLAAAELNGDGRTDLLAENGFFTFGPGSRAFYAVLLQEHCGNGIVEPPEVCDDGNRTHGDGCDGNCTLTACGNSVVSAGEECDDGDTLAGDGCSATCTGEAPCGDGIVTVPEECDDGNVLDGDCCSSSCTLDPSGTACGAATTLCTIGSCTGAGSCQVVARPPRPMCRRIAAAHAGRLTLRDRSDDRLDRLDWRWAKGTTTPKAAFGNPTTTTDYGLCIYDAGEQLLGAASLPAGSLCNLTHPQPCWKETGSGFRYGDPNLSVHGVRRIVLKQGLQDGKASVLVGGKGAGLDLPVLPIAPAALPLRVQLEAINGECWEATYGASVTRNTSDRFSAKSD